MKTSQASERPNSFDERGGKIRIIPAEVKGYFRTRRDWVQAVLIIFFLVLPWTRINGMQTLLLDISQRRFIFFGVQFMAHDAPLVFYIFAILTLGLALVTALWGRIWCGWACPQTTFIDGVYRRIEIWIEGKYIERRRLDQAPLSFNKLAKLALKWLIFIFVSSIIAHSFIAYFVGVENLLQMTRKNPHENWSYFVLISAITGILAFNFGWFREQFCMVMCPYGRFQSVLMDSNSITVLYDEKRNDCVNCNRCVQVCPTGIDIRHGVQLECIACTACVDACDEIMRKVKKPEGLIRYASLHEKARILRPRTLAYGLIFSVMVSLLGFSYVQREAFSATIVRGQDSPYQIIKTEEGSKILNHFKIHLYNQTNHDLIFTISLDSKSATQDLKLIIPDSQSQVSAYANKELHFFVEAALGDFDSQGKIDADIFVQIDLGDEILRKPIVIVGPQKEGESL